MRLYGEFTKVTPREDGALTVEGICSSEVVDSDGETILATAIAAALDDYRKFPAVREMHRSDTAAGTALDIRVDADRRTRIDALIVDPVTCKKITAGVLRGFSVGGRVLRRSPTDPNVIEALALTEISLVDRPANAEAVVTLVKLDAGASQPLGDAPPPPAPEPTEPVCKVCAGPLTCAKCNAEAEKAAREVGRREVAAYLHKLSEVEAALRKAETALAERTRERDEVQRRLASMPKGALLAMPKYVLVEKAADVAGAAVEDDKDEPLTPAQEIKKLHAQGGRRVS